MPLPIADNKGALLLDKPTYQTFTVFISAYRLATQLILTREAMNISLCRKRRAVLTSYSVNQDDNVLRR